MKPFRYRAFAILAVAVLQGCAVLVDPGNEPTAKARVDFSDPVLNQRRILVAGSVTETVAEATIRQLLYLDAQNDQSIDLFLMTPGGDLKAAYAIQHAIEGLRSRVNTVALGECNSAGVLLLAGGTGERQAFRDSTIVIHGIGVRGKPPARYVELTQQSYTDFWQHHARLPAEWLPIPPGKTFVLTAQEALEYGVIDKVIETRTAVPKL